MLNRRRTWFLLAVLIGVALAVYFEPSHCVRGWLWGEAFFDGRPTSYWREIVSYELRTDPSSLSGDIPPPPQPWLLRCVNSVIAPPNMDSSFRLLQDTEADGVLRGLAEDEDCGVSGFARDILLEVRPTQPFSGLNNDEFRAWWPLIRKHHRNPRAFDF
jgi:hypothetical protein